MNPMISPFYRWEKRWRGYKKLTQFTQFMELKDVVVVDAYRNEKLSYEETNVAVSQKVKYKFTT